MELNFLNNYTNFKSIVDLIFKKSHLKKKKLNSLFQKILRDSIEYRCIFFIL